MLSESNVRSRLSEVKAQSDAGGTGPRSTSSGGLLAALRLAGQGSLPPAGAATRGAFRGIRARGRKNSFMKTKRENQRRCLLATTTNEPFQPVRLHNMVPDKSFVVRKLEKLDLEGFARFLRESGELSNDEG
jgi:hypothetical protein